MSEQPEKIELIKWLDSYGCTPEWSELEPPFALTCRSVGWVVFETDESIVVAPHRSDVKESECFCGNMTIPKAAIVSRETLSEEEKIVEPDAKFIHQYLAAESCCT